MKWQAAPSYLYPGKAKQGQSVELKLIEGGNNAPLGPSIAFHSVTSRGKIQAGDEMAARWGLPCDGHGLTWRTGTVSSKENPSGHSAKDPEQRGWPARRAAPTQRQGVSSAPHSLLPTVIARIPLSDYPQAEESRAELD